MVPAARTNTTGCEVKRPMKKLFQGNVRINFKLQLRKILAIKILVHCFCCNLIFFVREQYNKVQVSQHTSHIKAFVLFQPSGIFHILEKNPHSYQLFIFSYLPIVYAIFDFFLGANVTFALAPASHFQSICFHFSPKAQRKHLQLITKLIKL